MMASRGMGAINPSKMPGKKEIIRKDDPNKVAMYKRGGQVKRMDEGGETEAPEKDVRLNIPETKSKGPSVKPTHIVANKNFASVGAKLSSGDIPIGDSGTASFGADTSVSAAKGQRAKAMVNQLEAGYKHQFDKDTNLGLSVNKSPTEKRFMVALNKSFAEGGETGLYANINAKRKRIAAGSGEKMRKPGSKGAPTKQAFINSAKTAKK
jgi:hypothetical protein